MDIKVQKLFYLSDNLQTPNLVRPSWIHSKDMDRRSSCYIIGQSYELYLLLIYWCYLLLPKYFIPFVDYTLVKCSESCCDAPIVYHCISISVKSVCCQMFKCSVITKHNWLTIQFKKTQQTVMYKSQVRKNLSLELYL